MIALKPVVNPFGIAAVCSGFIFQDDNAWPHRTRIVENFHERKVVMTIDKAYEIYTLYTVYQ